MTKRYSFITRSTGNKANIRPVATREQARAVKQAKNFRVAIWDNLNSTVVR